MAKRWKSNLGTHLVTLRRYQCMLQNWIWTFLILRQFQTSCESAAACNWSVEVQNRKISNYSQRPNSLWQLLQPVTSVNETLNGALPRKGLFVSHGRNELVEAVWMLKTNSYHYSNDTLDRRISEIVGHWTLGQTPPFLRHFVACKRRIKLEPWSLVNILQH